jgi:hypothetical protein
MAMAIHPVPVLEGQAAIDFEKKLHITKNMRLGNTIPKKITKK